LSSIFCLQFDPELFVDSLLGIGQKGSTSGFGGGSSKGEGQLLSDRLAEMRKERDARASVMQQKQQQQQQQQVPQKELVTSAGGPPPPPPPPPGKRNNRRKSGKKKKSKK